MLILTLALLAIAPGAPSFPALSERVGCSPILASTTSPKPIQADHLVVKKSTHILTLYRHGQVLRTYRVGLGRATGPKQQQGDHRTPEGHYTIDAHKPDSSFHLALHISYPNPEDRRRARQSHLPTGCDIMIPGLPPRTALLGPLQHMPDWTDGCIALSNAEMDEVYKLVPNGTPLDINP